MPENALDELKELREAVNQSSEHTLRQLQCIESNTFLGSLVVSIIVALGLSYQLKILLYWIPASFLLMYLLALYGLLTNTKKFNNKNIEKSIEIYQTIEKKKFDISLLYIFKNVSPLMKAISIIYIITLLILVLITNGTINTNYSISFLIPSVVALIYAPMPFLFDNSIKQFQNGLLHDSYNQLMNAKENFRPQGWKLILLGIKILFILTYLLLIIFLPLIALYITGEIVNEFLFLVLVLVLQFVIIILSANHFSGLLVKRELSNTITNFAYLNYRINDAILSNDISREKIGKLKHQYFTAKQYDLFIDDSLIYVNFYLLMMNSVHLNRK